MTLSQMSLRGCPSQPAPTFTPPNTHTHTQPSHLQETNLELGFPANLVHVIRPDSVLYNLSLLEMDTRMMEVRDGGGVGRGR